MATNGDVPFLVHKKISFKKVKFPKCLMSNVHYNVTVFKEKRCVYENKDVSVPQRHAMEPVDGVEVIEY